MEEVAALGRSFFSMDEHVPHTLRMDEASPVDVIAPGEVGEVARRPLDISRASVDYPVKGTPWGEKGSMPRVAL